MQGSLPPSSPRGTDQHISEQSDSRIIIDLHLRKPTHNLPLKPKPNVPRSIPTFPPHALKVLDPGHHHIHALAQEPPHVLAPKFHAHRARHPLVPTELLDILLRPEDRRPHPRDRLHHHRRHGHQVPICSAILEEGMDVDFFQARDVAEGDVLLQ